MISITVVRHEMMGVCGPKKNQWEVKLKLVIEPHLVFVTCNFVILPRLKGVNVVSNRMMCETQLLIANNFPHHFSPFSFGKKTAPTHFTLTMESCSTGSCLAQ